MKEYSIELMDGRKISGILKSEQPKEVKADDLKLDTTGQYLSFKKKFQVVSDDIMNEAQRQYNHHLFTENAWFLLANAEKIFSDTRMFLAPVNIVNGLAYTGTSGFAKPTIGVYLEWWLYHKKAAVDKNGNLVWYISGSPLSGSNCCMSVTPDGEHVKIAQHTPFSAIWGSFMKVNKRYTEAKQRCEAYTLEEVLIRLHGEDYCYRLVELKHEMIDMIMKWENSKLQNCCDYLKKKIQKLFDYNKVRQLLQYREEILEFYNDYRERQKVICELEKTYVERHKELKKQFHAGTLEGDYHKLLADASREYRIHKARQSDSVNKFIHNIFGKNLNGITPTDILEFCKTHAD